MGARLGQHFLVNKGIIEKIIRAASLSASDAVLEIGPGRGALTFALGARVKKVIAVEKDKSLVAYLQKEVARRNITNVEIVRGDIRSFLASHFVFHVPHYKVVANIPYYLTSALVRALLECPAPPSAILLMMQKEVAQRIVAKNSKESILSLSVKFYAEPRVLFAVSRGSFAPPPNVDSAVIEIKPHVRGAQITSAQFFAVMRAGFSAPRKYALSNIAKRLGMPQPAVARCFAAAGVDTHARAEDMTLAQWIALAKNTPPAYNSGKEK